MRTWKRHALQLVDFIRDADLEGRGLTFVELYGSTGLSRSTLRGALAWLEDIGAVERRIDVDKRPRWSALPDDDAASDAPLVDDPRLANILSELLGG